MFGLFGINIYSGFSEHFGQRRFVGGYYRSSTGHSFQRRIAETLVQRRMDENIGLLIGFEQSVVAEVSGEK